MSGGASEPIPGRRSRLIPELMTVNEVAAALRLSRSRVYELINTRELRAYRLGGRIRIPAEAVRTFLRDSRL